MSEQENLDTDKERVKRFFKYAAFILGIVIIWYVLDLAESV